MNLPHSTSQRLLFALSEIDTHWESYEGCLRELIERIERDPPDPRIANGDYCREELGDPVGYYEHELNSLLKNRDLIRAVFVELMCLALPAGRAGVLSCCPGEHSFDKTCLAVRDIPACQHLMDAVCDCICHTKLVIHDRACCDKCRECGERIRINYEKDTILRCCDPLGGNHTYQFGCNATSPCFDPACPEKQKRCEKCDPHPWTKRKLVVVTTPYAAMEEARERVEDHFYIPTGRTVTLRPLSESMPALPKGISWELPVVKDVTSLHRTADGAWEMRAGEVTVGYMSADLVQQMLKDQEGQP